MSKYNIVASIYFEKKYKKLIVKQPEINVRLIKVFGLLIDNPFSSGLRTHKVVSRRHGEKWSSYVGQDIRIIWEFDGDKLKVICVLDIGGHSGKNKVYK